MVVVVVVGCVAAVVAAAVLVVVVFLVVVVVVCVLRIFGILTSRGPMAPCSRGYSQPCGQPPDQVSPRENTPILDFLMCWAGGGGFSKRGAGIPPRGLFYRPF